MARQEQAFEALSRWKSIARPIEQLNARLEDELSTRHGLCVSAYEVLYILSTREERTPLTEVVKNVDRSQPRVSRLVTQLEERGLVDRHPDPDGRKRQLGLTPEGHRALQAASTTISIVFEDVDVSARIQAAVAH